MIYLPVSVPVQRYGKSSNPSPNNCHQTNNFHCIPQWTWNTSKRKKHKNGTKINAITGELYKSHYSTLILICLLLLYDTTSDSIKRKGSFKFLTLRGWPFALQKNRQMNSLFNYFGDWMNSNYTSFSSMLVMALFTSFAPSSYTRLWPVNGKIFFS